MTAAGDQVLAYAYTWLGYTEEPPGSNNVVFWEPWGGNYGAWCAAFVSYIDSGAGFPLPPIDGAPGFSYCPSGQIAAFTTGHSVGSAGVEAGDTLIFSWEPFYYGGDGVAYCSSGVYAGAPAGDHTGFFVEWLGGEYMRTIEGNTSQSSWDAGGAVMERTDRYAGQICCYARHESMRGPGSQLPDDEEEDDMMRYMVRAEDGSAYAVDGIKAYPIASGYTVQVLQVTGNLMTREQMNAKGWTVDVDGGSINASFEIQRITEHTPDQ